MNDLTKQEQPENQMLAMIEKVAFDPNVDVAKMEVLLSMQERIFDKNAKIAFNKAMVACQAEMPIVTSTAHNKQTNSSYVKYEHLMQQTKAIYVKHGFGLSFGEVLCSKKDNITVACDVVHVDGFSKIYEATLPIDSAGIKGTVNKTGIHATSSAYTYAKRYLFTMIFNIAVAKQDDDGNQAGGVTIEQLLEYNGHVRAHIHSIAAVKNHIYNKDLEQAAECWYELEQPEQISLWRAKSKGGIFTTEEQKIIKSDEFAALNPLRNEDFKIKE